MSDECQQFKDRELQSIEGLLGMPSQIPEMVFFEVLNEPEVGAYRWSGIQQSVVEAIRQSAPQHTIIVTCGDYSNPDDLVRMPELAGSNYIVNFHYYQPHIFTHQGASWGERTG